MRNLQEDFNKSVWYFADALTQCKSPFDDAICVYRRFDETGAVVGTCVFGNLIPDDRYKPEMEDHSAAHVINVYLSDIFPDDGDLNNFRKNGPFAEFYRSMQVIHDEEMYWYNGRADMIFELDTIAAKFELDTSAIRDAFNPERYTDE